MASHSNYSDFYFSVEMSYDIFASVNVTISMVGLALNIIFVYFMVFPQQEGEHLKQPLNILLGLLVGCNTSIHACSLSLVFMNYILSVLSYMSFTLNLGPDMFLSFMTYAMILSVATSQWKNVYYYCQIVPHQHFLFIWFKKNVRVLIYSALMLNFIFCLFGFIVDMTFLCFLPKVFQMHFENVTAETLEGAWKILLINNSIQHVDYWFRLGLIFACLCMMAISSSAIVLYLWRHMKNMEESIRNSFSSPVQRQIKLTCIGMIGQAFLHFICSAVIVIDELLDRLTVLDFDYNGFIFCTSIALYSFGTSIIMSFVQSMFRQGLVRAGQKLLQTLKTCINLD